MRRAQPVVENKPQRITKAELMKRFGWDDEQLAMAQRCGLPKAHQRIVDNALWLEPRTQWYRSADEVEQWIADVRSLAEGMR
jgi:hypothetical protein